MLSDPRKITCPFCFSSFTLQEIHFRCLEPRCNGREEDKKFANERGLSPVVKGHTFGAPQDRRFNTNPRVAACDVCGMLSHTLLCPECHFELSQDVGMVEQRIIAVIGGTNTGKSHYIASLISALRSGVGNDFNISLRMLDDETQRRWEQDFYRPLFERKTVLNPTLPGATDARVKAPLVFRLTSKNGLVKRILNISIFDTSGEDMKAEDEMSVQARFIPHADGIIFLIDPLQIDYVRQMMPHIVVRSADPMAQPEFILNRIIKIIEQSRNRTGVLSNLPSIGGFSLGGMQKITMPVAFTLSKTDILSFIDPGSALHRFSEHHGVLDLNEVQSVSTEVAGYLQQWINPNFTNTINDAFSNYDYFGVSALGIQPDGQNTLIVSPKRVEDPFLWLLQKWGFIRAKKIR